jgi:DNA topoisomerase-3
VLICDDAVFEVKGSVIKQAGWRSVFSEREDTAEDEAAHLPDVKQSEQFPVLQTEILEKQTKPKPLHTEASLLAAMEQCGKEVENEAEREALKAVGIGTPATRAAIIETLFLRDYIQRQKKSLIPTEKGLSVYETVKGKRIADVALTGDWENTLAQIERGEMMPETFQKVIEVYTRQITAELLDAAISPSTGGGQGEDFLCPKCKTAAIRFYPKAVKCTAANCGLTVFRSISEKQLTDKQITDLLKNGKTDVIKGFKNKAGKTFPAALKFDNDFRIVYDFPQKKK